MHCRIVTDKILKPVFSLQINQTRGKQIVLILRNFCKGIKLGCNFCCEMFLATQYRSLY